MKKYVEKIKKTRSNNEKEIKINMKYINEKSILIFL